jgi:hypothetical protein
MHEGKVHTRTTTIKTRDREVEGGGGGWGGDKEVQRCSTNTQSNSQYKGGTWQQQDKRERDRGPRQITETDNRYSAADEAGTQQTMKGPMENAPRAQSGTVSTWCAGTCRLPVTRHRDRAAARPGTSSWRAAARSASCARPRSCPTRTCYGYAYIPLSAVP